MSLTLGGIGDRRSLMSIPRSAAPATARSSNFTETPRNISYGNGANSPSVKPPSAETLKIKQAAVNQANNVVGSRTLSGSLGGVAPSVLQMPKAIAPKGVAPRSIQPRAMEQPSSPQQADASPERSSYGSSSGKSLSVPSRPLPSLDPRIRRDAAGSYAASNPSTRGPAKSEAPPPEEDFGPEEEEYPDDQEFADVEESPRRAELSVDASPRAVASTSSATNEKMKEMKDTIRMLANATLEMKQALSKMQTHLSDQNKKWSETEQKLKYEIGEMAKVRDNFGAQMSSLKTDLRTLREDIGGVGISEKFDQLDGQIADLRDRTNQFVGTLLRDVWAYLTPPMELFTIDRVSATSQPTDTEFLSAGSQVVLMPPATKSDETGFWIRARLICRKGGNQKIYWVPLDTVPLALPPSAVHPDEPLSKEGTVECIADFHLFGTGSGYDGGATECSPADDSANQNSDDGVLVHLP